MDMDYLLCLFVCLFVCLVGRSHCVLYYEVEAYVGQRRDRTRLPVLGWWKEATSRYGPIYQTVYYNENARYRKNNYPSHLSIHVYILNMLYLLLFHMDIGTNEDTLVTCKSSPNIIVLSKKQFYTFSLYYHSAVDGPTTSSANTLGQPQQLQQQSTNKRLLSINDIELQLRRVQHQSQSSVEPTYGLGLLTAGNRPGNPQDLSYPPFLGLSVCCIVLPISLLIFLSPLFSLLSSQ